MVQQARATRTALQAVKGQQTNGDNFTATAERQSGVSMYIPQSPTTGNHATYQNDLKKLAWYYAVWQ